MGLLVQSAVFLALWVPQLPAKTVAYPTRPLVHLQSGVIDVLGQPQRQHKRDIRRALLQTPAKDARWGPLASAEQLLIAYNKSRQQETLQSVRVVLQDRGFWLGSYIPDDTVLGIGDGAAAEAVRQLDGVIWVGDYQPEHKMAPDWQRYLAMPQQLREDVTLAVSFPLLHDVSPGEHPQAPLLSPRYDPGSAAEAAWQQELASAGISADVTRRNQHLVTVTVSPEALLATLDWLGRHPSVHWIAPFTDARLHNWQGTAITQCATAAPNAPVSLTADQGTHPIWEAGLTGEGEIIGAGDSGMDYEHCYFADLSVNWTASLETDPSTGAVSFNSTAHRKIRLYQDLGNGVDSGGHGTHTMGSLLGMPINTSDLGSLDYRGIAPDAKLAFTDLGSNSTGGIYTPEDLVTGYFSFAYDVGARVHSDSWGSSSTSYDAMAAQVDLYTWENQDFTAVFAAGNEGSAGASPDQGATTVSSPATSKNCIAAGATEVAGQSFTGNPQYVTADMSVHQPVNSSGSDSAVEVYMVMQAAFGGQVSSMYGRQFPLSVASPVEGCSMLQNSAEVRGTVVLIERGTCYFSTKVANAQAAGAAAAMVYDNEINDFFLLAADGSSASSITIPGMSVPRCIGQLLASSTEAGGGLPVSFGAASTVPEAWANLAPFSSKGPTPDGRVKPDLLAPGTLLSAYTDPATGNTCDLRTMQGTSMATPLIAGSAALVRQYFLSGRYPTGAQSQENAFSPSGPLVKAVLIGGAAGLSGYEPDTGLPLAPPPSFRQGFGRVQLSQSLPLQGSGPGWSMQLVDMANLTTGQSHQYCLNGTGGPLTVTLVWHDYPAALSAAKALVNDLDLTVRAAGLNGFPLLGNGGNQGSNGSDRTNNVEQVSVSYLPPGQISIQVDGYQVFSAQGPQPYALVALGSFSGVLASPSNPVNGGSATSGVCTVVVVQISGGPQGLTNETDIVFTFGLQSGNNAGVAFECALEQTDALGNDDQNSTSLAYSACSSPVSYANLSDGAFSFYVRAQGEQLADSRAFFKDTTPPQLSFLGDLPPSTTAAATAKFTFNATDSASVAFSCRLWLGDAAAMQGDVTALQMNGPVLDSWAVPGQWQPCVSPVVLYWLLPGQWRFEVDAVDGAGNAAATVLAHNWTVAFDAGSTYARFAKAPLGLIGAANQSFQLQALQDVSGNLTVSQEATFQCRLIQGSAAEPAAGNLTAAADSALTGDATAWASCGATASFGRLDDGAWAVAARAGSDATADEVAITAFTIDSQPPNLQITEAPGEYTNSSNVSVQFVSNTTGVAFKCLLVGEGNATVNGSSAFVPCSSPSQWDGLADGQYTFSVTGVDRVGNQAAPEDAEFFVDTQPPTFNDIRYPVGVQRGDFQVAFLASDGPDGPGIAEVQCRIVPIKLGSAAADQSSASYSWQNCSSPHSYSGLQPGHWSFSMSAIDIAGLQQMTGEMDIWVESLPPTTAVAAGPLQNQSVPPEATFNFTSLSGSDIGTPIQASQCRLVQISTQTAAQYVAAPPGNTPLPGTVLQPASGGLAGGSDSQPVAGAPSWAQQPTVTVSGSVAGNQSVDGAAAHAPAPGGVAIRTFAAAVGTGWGNCSSPVTYKGLSSGNYSFQSQAEDVAGNQGQPTNNYLFQVDANLALSGASGAAFWGLGWKFWLIVGGGGAAAVATVVTLVACCCLCRRPTARLHPHGTYISHENTVATPRGAQPTPRATPRGAATAATAATAGGFDMDATASALRLSLANHRLESPRGPGSPSRLSARSSGNTPRSGTDLAMLEEAQVKLAIARSLENTPRLGRGSPLADDCRTLNPSASSSELPSPGLLSTLSSRSCDEDRALLATHRGDRDTDLHRALMLSLQEAASRARAQLGTQPTAPPAPQE